MIDLLLWRHTSDQCLIIGDHQASDEATGKQRASVNVLYVFTQDAAVIMIMIKRARLDLDSLADLTQHQS